MVAHLLEQSVQIIRNPMSRIIHPAVRVALRHLAERLRYLDIVQGTSVWARCALLACVAALPVMASAQTTVTALNAKVAMMNDSDYFAETDPGR